MSTLEKHRSFVSEPAGEKPVTDIAGIGRNLGKRLANLGYCKAINVVGQFLIYDGNPHKFREFMVKIGSATKKQADEAYECVKEYTDKFNETVYKDRSKREIHHFYEILLNFMEMNPDMAKGYGRGYGDKWDEISVVLNDIKQVLKCGSAWRKEWADMKCSVKNELLYGYPINEQKERLARISGIDILVDEIRNFNSSVVPSSELKDENIIKIVERLSKIEQNHRSNKRRIIMSLESMETDIRDIKNYLEKIRK